VLPTSLRDSLQPSRISLQKARGCREISSRIGVLPDPWDAVSEKPMNPCAGRVLSQIGTLPHDWDGRSAAHRTTSTHAGRIALAGGTHGKSRIHSAHGPTADTEGKASSRAQHSIFTKAFEPHIPSIATWIHCDDLTVSSLSTLPTPWDGAKPKDGLEHAGKTTPDQGRANGQSSSNAPQDQPKNKIKQSSPRRGDSETILASSTPDRNGQQTPQNNAATKTSDKKGNVSNVPQDQTKKVTQSSPDVIAQQPRGDSETIQASSTDHSGQNNKKKRCSHKDPV